MSAHCQVTGRGPGFGNTVSHSHRRTRRRWNPNIQIKSYFLPSEGRRIKLRYAHQGGRNPPRRREGLMARNDIRLTVKLRSTAGTGYTYVTTKNRRNDPDRLVLRKFDPIARRHVDFQEER